jgi:hypothetical protein
MNATHRQSSLPAVVIIGLTYALVGILFAQPASHAQFWRLAAWVVSGAAYGIHVWYERVRLGNSTFAVALHVALGAALGAFGLAVGAILHALAEHTTAQHQRLLFIALFAWPVITGVPAFLVGLAASGVLGRLARGRLDAGRFAPRDEWRMAIPSMLRKPSAFIPAAMSLGALTVVIIHIAMHGTGRQADEGAAAHLWQLLMGAQVPIIAFFAIRWLPRSPKDAWPILALQAVAALAALAPVYLLHW